VRGEGIVGQVVGWTHSIHWTGSSDQTRLICLIGSNPWIELIHRNDRIGVNFHIHQIDRILQTCDQIYPPIDQIDQIDWLGWLDLYLMNFLNWVDVLLQYFPSCTCLYCTVYSLVQ